MKEFLYKILDLATFGRGMKRVINGKEVRLPTRFYRYFPDNYEKDNFRFFFDSVKPGDTVLDFGAHIGLFAAMAAKAVGSSGKVYAFEPSPSTNELLKKTVQINNASACITTFQKAVGGAVGKTTFFVGEQADNANSLVNYKEDRPFRGIDIDVTTIDAFVKEQQLAKIDFIKIDVEGVEYDAMRGAVETFRKFRPKAILAIHPEPVKAKGDSLEGIYELVKELNYTALYEGAPISREAFCKHTDLIDLHLVPA
ncbi:MAG TPA: FkbM family methyltransferase [Ferruginibacter sp.]|nr:FkbM family methyltransferase [Ferruginibacter sp.]